MEDRTISSSQDDHSISNNNLEEMRPLLNFILSDDIKSKTAEEILLDKRADNCPSVEEIFDCYLRNTKIEFPHIKAPYFGHDERASSSSRKYFLLETPRERLKFKQQGQVLQEKNKRKALVLDEDNSDMPTDVLHVGDEGVEKISLQDDKMVLTNADDTLKKLSVGLATAKAVKKRKIPRRTAPLSSDEENEVNSDGYLDTSIHESKAADQASPLGSRFSARLASKKRKKHSEKEESKDMIPSDAADNLKEYVCQSCKMQINKNFKQAHELWHTKTAQYNCEFCKVSSNDRLFLSRHLKTQNHYKLSGQSLAKKMKFNCTVEGCQKKCVSKRALRQHDVRNHPKPESIITCKNCIFTAVDQSVIDNHMLKVNHGANWICASCGLSTGSNGALLQHARKHKETQCIQCNYKAEFPVKLIKHYREDKHGLDLSCNVCNEKHSSFKALNQHRLLDHQIKEHRKK